MNRYSTHEDAVPLGMLIDVRQQARGSTPDYEGKSSNKARKKWRPEWDAVARKAALSGLTAIEIAEYFGCSCKNVQIHLIRRGMRYSGKHDGGVVG